MQSLCMKKPTHICSYIFLHNSISDKKDTNILKIAIDIKFLRTLEYIFIVMIVFDMLF